MARQRDFKAEYARRLASGSKRGLSRSQARGHARPGELGLRPPPFKDIQRLEAALKSMRRSGSQSAAAKALNISAERFRRYLRENSLAERAGRSWRFTDNRPRLMQVISEGEILRVKFAGFDQPSLNGEHLAAVRAFISSNDLVLLRPFQGRAVIDAKGRAYPLETNPNVLHRLAAQGDEVFHEIYRLII